MNNSGPFCLGYFSLGSFAFFQIVPTRSQGHSAMDSLPKPSRAEIAARLMERYKRHQEKMRSPEYKRRKLKSGDNKLAMLNWSTLEALPDEVVYHILSFLPLETLIDLSETSHRLHQVTHDERLWKDLCFMKYGQLQEVELYRFEICSN